MQEFFTRLGAFVFSLFVIRYQMVALWNTYDFLPNSWFKPAITAYVIFAFFLIFFYVKMDKK